MGNNKHASKKVLGSLMDSFKSTNREYKPKDIRDDIGNRFGVTISYNQAWRAKCHTLQMLRGSSDDSFRMLPIYLYNIMIYNPGSVTNVIANKENKFLMCYYSLGIVVHGKTCALAYALQPYASFALRPSVKVANIRKVRSFVQCCCPIIIVDVAHLKSGYLGTNLVTVAMDDNNRIFPLAYGIGEGETNEVWS
ncbi:uncharacterized protein [Rutidosis leptorrhynchoides]|uniref:uncharacterized protein n=1 Tax=Rutidosis leptorrhynchoides TaxID=125765 RepID=UPI003A99681B